MEGESNMNMCRAHWENSSMDQNDPFESALSSMVSSPTASNNGGGGENIVLRELIGRLGSICNSGEISPFNANANGNNSSSCYSTPLNSPPKLHFLSLPTLAPPFSARFSKENSTLSDHQIPIPNPRKRKGKETIATINPASASASASENSDECSGKRSKSKKEKVKEKNSINGEAEPQKDYIHVRARRGQATDAHSLAERVRREKIGERMKFLQDLVPGCNKVTGKAVMLDEIINYVQSLQRQVEFLSMKLSTVNPRMDFNMEALLSKDTFHSLPHNIYPCSDTYPFQSQHNNADAALGRNQGLQLPPKDNFGDAASQVSSLWEDDLHSIVQMGLGTQNFQGIVPTSQMKVEL